MNLSKVAIALTILIANAAALGSRPGETQGYFMLTKSGYIRTRLIRKLDNRNRVVFKQQIKNAKLRAQLFNLLNPQPTAEARKNKSNSRMKRLRQFHH